MTPIEKANELFYKFYELYPYQDLYFIAKKAALVAVEEILKSHIQNEQSEWWKAVKQHIETL